MLLPRPSRKLTLLPPLAQGSPRKLPLRPSRKLPLLDPLHNGSSRRVPPARSALPLRPSRKLMLWAPRLRAWGAAGLSSDSSTRLPSPWSARTLSRLPPDAGLSGSALTRYPPALLAWPWPFFLALTPSRALGLSFSARRLEGDLSPPPPPEEEAGEEEEAGSRLSARLRGGAS